jgi:pseudouridine synthase
MRLNKILSSAGVASRRAADELIRQGRVTLNGAIVSELGTKADPERDDIRVDGRRVGAPPARRYLLMNKPRGVVSTRSDPQRRKTVIDLLRQAGINGYFYPVGRLDYDSEGLLLLTNDGGLAERAMHPRYGLTRTYEAQVVGVPEPRDLERLRRGVVIDDRRTLPADVRQLRVVPAKGGPQAVLEITIREGRNRQVRRMCDAIAHPVERLRRTRLGPIADAKLKPGQIRELTPREVASFLEPDAPPRAAMRASRPPADRARNESAPSHRRRRSRS